MSAPPPQRAVCLDVDPHALLGQLHAPAGTALATAVLIVAPWGWDAVAAHRSLRAWAQHLARAGHVALRFDLPACGDSAGTPSDPALVESWVAAITAAADWLRAESGCERIATLGLGLGGLLAGRSVADGARIDDLVLWAAPPRGRAFVRQQRAFSELQSSRMTLDGEAEPSTLPEGWLEAGGFVLSAETIAALERVDLRSLRLDGLRRALLLERDGAGIDVRLRDRLEQAGVDVSIDSGDGWEAMVFHPERPHPPEEVYARVTWWLAAVADGPAAPPTRSPTVIGELALEIDGERVRETPWTVAPRSGRLAGVLCEPLDEPTSGLCVVFLNAGAVRRVGPNRIWVEAARRWAARGVPSLRIDLEGIGDADGDAGRYRDVTQFYRPELVGQVGAALDALEDRGVGERFLLLGLCSGGYWAFQAALREQRVSAALLLNSGALVWQDDLIARREGRKIARLRERDWRRKIVRGDVTTARMLAIARTYLVGTLRRKLRRGPPPVPEASSIETSIERGLDRLRDTKTRLVLAFSGDEALYAELEKEGVLGRLERWPGVELATLPGRDHTLRPIVAQRAVHELIDRQLALELARTAPHRPQHEKVPRPARRS